MSVAEPSGISAMSVAIADSSKARARSSSAHRSEPDVVGDAVGDQLRAPATGTRRSAERGTPLGRRSPRRSSAPNRARRPARPGRAARAASVLLPAPDRSGDHDELTASDGERHVVAARDGRRRTTDSPSTSSRSSGTRSGRVDVRARPTIGRVDRERADAARCCRRPDRRPASRIRSNATPACLRRASTRPTIRGRKLSQPRYAVNSARVPRSNDPGRDRSGAHQQHQTEPDVGGALAERLHALFEHAVANRGVPAPFDEHGESAQHRLGRVVDLHRRRRRHHVAEQAGDALGGDDGRQPGTP